MKEPQVWRTYGICDCCGRDSDAYANDMDRTVEIRTGVNTVCICLDCLALVKEDLQEALDFAGSNQW